jgi:hypothetical protein
VLTPRVQGQPEKAIKGALRRKTVLEIDGVLVV